MPCHASISGSASDGHVETRNKLAESPGTLHYRRRLAHVFADVLNASNSIRFGEQCFSRRAPPVARRVTGQKGIEIVIHAGGRRGHRFITARRDLDMAEGRLKER
jgi:hypothetical protein